MFFARRLCAVYSVLAAAVLAGCGRDPTGVELTLEYPRAIAEVFIGGDFDDGREAFEPRTFTLQAPAGEKGVGTIVILLPDDRHGSQLSLRLVAGNVMRSVAVVVVSGSIVAASATLVEVIVPPDTVCGDGDKEGLEGCDDGRLDDGDGCSAACGIEMGWTCAEIEGARSECEAVCGDGLILGIERCDDNNELSFDGCDLSCVIEDGWMCSGMPSMCSNTCGNGAFDDREECDDQNNVSGDGCDAACALEPGFMCSKEAPSRCDEICSDGLVRGAEECDDGNREPGDGCASCGVEPGWHCLERVEPSRCFSPTTVFVDRAANCEEADGSFQKRFCTITEGVDAATSTVVVFPGEYREKVVLDANVTLISTGSATIAWAMKDALKIEAGTEVTVRGFAVTGVGATGGGVKADDAIVHLEDCSIGPSAEVGVAIAGKSFLRLQRSFVHDNAKGGVRLDGTMGFELYNNIIVRNAVIGGVYAKRALLTSKIVNNTIADNSGGANMPGDHAGGVQCDMPATVANSILSNNAGGHPSGASLLCTVRYSIIQGERVPNLNNVVGDPGIDQQTFRLLPGSVAIDAADPAGVLPTGPAPIDDIDHQTRPLGAGVDIGADERE